MKTLTLLLTGVMSAGLIGCGNPQNITTSKPSSSCGVSCRHGNEEGNGSDYIREEDGNAWFLGDQKVIRYCVRVASSFGVDTPTSEKAIAEAFSRWQKYFADKEIHKRSPPEVRITTQAKKISDCDGTQDLTFYFGVQPENGTGGLSGTRVGIANRLSYDKFSGWGKGYIWLTAQGTVIPDYSSARSVYPDWTRKYNLSGIISHELGHVLGLGHIGGTIMANDIANYLTADEPTRMRYLGFIDGYQELQTCDFCLVKADGNLGVIREATTLTPEDKRVALTIDTIKENFALLTGHAPKSKSLEIQAKLEQFSLNDFLLTITDGDDRYEFPIDFQFENAISYIGQTSFRTLISSRSNDSSGTMTTTMTSHDALSHDVTIVEGTLKTKDKTIPVTMTRNTTLTGEMTPSAPLMIRTVVNGEKMYLFSAYVIESRGSLF